jgi:NTP pyrophosphatase (non-canonical NTP hydrolase)
MTIEAIQLELRKFAQDRDWEQFHTVRNLILALVGEAGELAESVQWLGEIDATYLETHPEELSKIVEEVSDVFIYILRLADVLKVDIGNEALKKIGKNSLRYTQEASKGNARKH